jgi:hypothetical protein
MSLGIDNFLILMSQSTEEGTHLPDHFSRGLYPLISSMKSFCRAEEGESKNEGD